MGMKRFSSMLEDWARMGMRVGTFQLTGIQALVRREDSWSPQAGPGTVSHSVVLCK